MTASSDLLAISGAIAKTVHIRSIESRLIDHISVNLPQPIFDRLVVELREELPGRQTMTHGYDLSRSGDSFVFAGVRYRRMPG